MNAKLVMVGFVVVLGCASSRSGDGRAESGRFRNMDEVATGPRSGLAPVMVGGRVALPKFPENMSAREFRAFPIVAYVVDTTGVIEDLVFLNSTPPEVRRAVCDWTRVARFEPLHVLGRVRRGLAITSFGFFRSASGLPPTARPTDENAWQATIATMDPSELGAMLRGRPNC